MLKLPFKTEPSPELIEIGNEEIGVLEIPRKYALTAKEKIFIETHGYTSAQAQKMVMSRGQKLFTNHNELTEREIISLKKRVREEKDSYKKQDLMEELKHKQNCLIKMSEVFASLSSGSELILMDKGVNLEKFVDEKELLQKDIQDKRDLAYVGAIMTRIDPKFSLELAVEFREIYPALFEEVLLFANKEEGGKNEWDRQELTTFLMSINHFCVNHQLLQKDFNSLALRVITAVESRVDQSIIKQIKQQFNLESYKEVMSDDDFKSTLGV